MSTLTVKLSDEQVNRYGLQGIQAVSMNILMNRIKNKMAKDALHQCQTIAVERGLAAYCPVKLMPKYGQFI